MVDYMPIKKGGTLDEVDGDCPTVWNSSVSRARILKHLRSPGIDAKESLSPAYVAFCLIYIPQYIVYTVYTL